MSDPRPLLGDDDLVTGEAVALDLPAASVGLRVASGLIDVVAELVLLFAVYLVATVVSIGADDALYAVATLVSTVLVLVGVPSAIETLTRGRSLGKLALGLRTVRDDAGPIAFRHAFIRALIGVVEIWVLTGVPALVTALVSARGKRLGDVVAGTYVVRERFPFPGVRPAMMPPHLAAWATSADIAPLPDGLALAVRQFLDRAASLNAGSRATLGGRLAEQVLTHVAPAPPPGQHPEAVLAAVIAERRRRDEARLSRDEALRARLRQRRR
ncbi:MAG: RDD family protein [Nocardioidaceae bacterium]